MVQIGEINLLTPMVLAPMAGVTNPPFRQLCREFAEMGGKAAGVELASVRTQGLVAPAGLYTCEMITTRALVERIPETMNMVKPDMEDPVRSVQLYGVQPKVVAAAVKILVREDLADHIDLNFGCPVPKVTRKGGGSALPWKHDLFREVVAQAVRAATETSALVGRSKPVPVTAKIRIGIDEEHETYRDIAKIAREEGIAALTLHARTTAQNYSGLARWDAISILQNEAEIPVFGNGDIFEVSDAKAMLEQTGAAGVVIGRGCQGRPWIFYDLAAAFHGSQSCYQPTLAQVAQVILRHAELSIDHFNGDENRALREMRKHMAWYLRGFSVGGEQRHALGLVSTLTELQERLNVLDLQQEYPDAAHGPRGRAGTAKRPHLPDKWLESHTLSAAQRAKIQEAEIGISGG
ncbi:tRNA dihydrouridine synthase DusB [Arcanobacterium hippocoleae]|uniref:NifR3 family TIM-barrel protein n=1 Tax=Arcanobacterium hippocoleae TaxID=149017 RepID=A0ABU1T0T9_9ACTO|nr:tRNA dihydrouridine synthase DusB [Arcanobacterium hippocoleae]MDR6938984.1 nifR3 family TIM-barrel protein [Arcanobacterium hippocoleae]